MRSLLELWQARFKAFEKAYQHFAELAELDTAELSTTLNEALTKRCDYTMAVALSLFEAYMRKEGFKEAFPPKELIRQSYKRDYIQSQEVWIRTIEHQFALLDYFLNPPTMDKVVTFLREDFWPELQYTYKLFKQKEAQATSSKAS